MVEQPRRIPRRITSPGPLPRGRLVKACEPPRTEAAHALACTTATPWATYRCARPSPRTWASSAPCGVKPRRCSSLPDPNKGYNSQRRYCSIRAGRIWMEEPGYPGAQLALRAAGAWLVPVPVDQEGLDVSEGIRRCRTARAAYITPSHQFPLGVTLSAARRMQLLNWAAHSGTWIIEDDYDSEYRFGGRPIASLQGSGYRRPRHLRGHVQQGHVPRHASRVTWCCPRIWCRPSPWSARRPTPVRPPCIRRLWRISSAKGISRAISAACANCTPNGARHWCKQSSSTSTESSKC